MNHKSTSFLKSNNNNNNNILAGSPLHQGALQWVPCTCIYAILKMIYLGKSLKNLEDLN